MTRKIVTNEGKVRDLPRLKAQEWIDAGAARYYREDVPVKDQIAAVMGGAKEEPKPAAVEAPDENDAPVSASPDAKTPAPAKRQTKAKDEKTTD